MLDDLQIYRMKSKAQMQQVYQTLNDLYTRLSACCTRDFDHNSDECISCMWCINLTNVTCFETGAMRQQAYGCLKHEVGLMCSCMAIDLNKIEDPKQETTT